jgi:hypothetical protein
MAYVQARRRGWNPSELSFEEVHTLDKAVTALSKGTADYFMWEHFTTKPIVDAGIFRRLGDFPTPWSCFVVAGHEDFIEEHGPTVDSILDIINTVTADFKNIPSIDRTLAHRYEQKLEDIQQWLAMTTWSQSPISKDELSLIQSRLLDLEMITAPLELEDYVRS